MKLNTKQPLAPWSTPRRQSQGSYRRAGTGRGKSGHRPGAGMYFAGYRFVDAF